MSGDLFEVVPARPRLYENGLVHIPGYLDRAAQRALLADVEAALVAAPLFQPAMPKTGKPFSVKMSNCGEFGWVSDRDGGYRYQAMHPITKKPWPEIPRLAMQAWEDLSAVPFPPEACLINTYNVAAKMGLHQDSDEAELSAPVLSLSLGASCIFRVGGPTRGGKTQAIELASGDAVLLAGAARLAYHGVARILPGTFNPSPDMPSNLLANDGRINLTLRRVTRPA